VIETVLAVEDDALHSESLGQIFDCFGLARSCRSFRSTAVLQVLCTHKCSVASVSQWSDDQSWRVAEVFESVVDDSRDHLDSEHIAPFARSVFFPVVPQLRRPLEIINILDLLVK